MGSALTCLALLASKAAVGQTGGSFWMPPPSSTVAPGVDFAFYFILYVSTFFFVLIVALMAFFVVAYRRRSGVGPQPSASHNTALEITWSVIPIILVVVMFALGFQSYMDLRTTPSAAYEVGVTGQKWNWLFRYPDGTEDRNLHVPVDRPVRLLMTSQDVIHSLFIPAFRLKMDLVPGRYTRTWFHATQAGEYDLFCAEYCGTEHSNMLAKVVVHPPGEFEKWLSEAGNLLKRLSPVDAGRTLFDRKGCGQCHSVDGTVKVGPTLKGIFGETHQFLDGSSTEVDENYLRQSILEPGAKVRQGFVNQMPTYQGRVREEELGAIIEYIKSLK